MIVKRRWPAQGRHGDRPRRENGHGASAARGRVRQRVHPPLGNRRMALRRSGPVAQRTAHRPLEMAEPAASRCAVHIAPGISQSRLWLPAVCATATLLSSLRPRRRIVRRRSQPTHMHPAEPRSLLALVGRELPRRWAAPFQVVPGTCGWPPSQACAVGAGHGRRQRPRRAARPSPGLRPEPTAQPPAAVLLPLFLVPASPARRAVARP